MIHRSFLVLIGQTDDDDDDDDDDNDDDDADENIEHGVKCTHLYHFYSSHIHTNTHTHTHTSANLHTLFIDNVCNGFLLLLSSIFSEDATTASGCWSVLIRHSRMFSA